MDASSIIRTKDELIYVVTFLLAFWLEGQNTTLKCSIHRYREKNPRQLKKRASVYLTPEGEDVRLDCTARRAVVIEPSDPAVDLEGWDVKEPPLERVDDGLAESLPTAGSGSVAISADSGMEAPGGGGGLYFEGLEGLNGGVDLGRSGCGPGLECPYDLGVGVDGGLFLGKSSAERLLGVSHDGQGGDREGEVTVEKGFDWILGFSSTG